MKGIVTLELTLELLVVVAAALQVSVSEQSGKPGQKEIYNSGNPKRHLKGPLKRREVDGSQEEGYYKDLWALGIQKEPL